MDERLELVSITLTGNAEQFYVDEIQNRTSRANKSMSWGGMLQKFKDHFASETKQKCMSLFLQTLQIYSFERLVTSPREAYCANWQDLSGSQGAKPYGRGKIHFSQARDNIALLGCERIRLKVKRYTYQDLIDALFGSIADPVAYKDFLAREDVADNGRGRYRKYRWGSTKKAAREWLFADKRRYAFNPKTILRGNKGGASNSNMPTGPSSIICEESSCFNCETEGCMLRRCKRSKVSID